MALGSEVTIKRVSGHPRYRWRANFIDEGKRRGKYFKTKAEADQWADERRGESLDHGTATSLSAKERAAVIDTRQKIEELGWDLRSAMEFAIRAKAKLEPLEVEPDTALNHAVDYFQRAQRSVSISELAKELVTSKKNAGRSKRHQRDLKSKLEKFEGSFGDRPVATLESAEIENWLHRLEFAPGSVNSYRRILVLAFNYAIKRGYSIENPVLGIDKVAEVESEPEVLTVRQLNKLITSAEDRILPAIVIAAFAGLRSSEIEGTPDHRGLDWQDIDLKEGIILVRADVAKGRRKRYVPISKNLKAWLRSLAKSEGEVWPSNGRNLHEAARRKTGFGKPGTETKEEKTKKVKLKPWPKNALRHSYASYHLVEFRNAAELVINMGHKDDADTLYNHYRGLVRPKQANAYWALRPIRGKKVIRAFGG